MHFTFGPGAGPSTLGHDTYWQYEVFLNGTSTGTKVWGTDEDDAARRLLDAANEGFLHRHISASF